MKFSTILSNFSFRVFRAHIKYVHNMLYYRKVYVLQKENRPRTGVPAIMVGNHQNAVNDPLAIQFSFEKEKVHIFSRGDLFNIKPVAKFLTFIGVLPSFRMKTEGIETLGNNAESFANAGDILLRGGKVAIFPESYTQGHHRLGEYSQGYLRMAFEAAERSNFEQDILISPVAIHYSTFYSMQGQVLTKFTEPISLKPYYELYQQKPRTAWRTVNALVTKQLSEAMLSIADEENYEAIDYARKTYGVGYAKRKGINPKCLPERLKTDKELCAKLETLASEQAEQATPVMREFNALKEFTEAEGLRDFVFDNKLNWAKAFMAMCGLVLTFPLLVAALWPNILIFYLPRLVTSKLRKKNDIYSMRFIGGVQFAMSSMLTIPLFYSISFVLGCIYANVWIALLYVLLWPYLGVFAWYYRLAIIKLRTLIKFNHNVKHAALYAEWVQRRAKLFATLDGLLK